ncbi:helix-turn-helix transcriptional regulator [Sediminibacterium sp.]|uniref:helix-turn-helix domain-containing protein n=1 Tax=Sediminibacterium sp. TaxID=1917865 RepID=UPI0025CECC9E|nr:helix-turn-helix transcriptional regulator [Sediminibacterium sp.]MDP2419829.1 helix-turn-helix transcriptional regulator [Sediminibacterium sp.]
MLKELVEANGISITKLVDRVGVSRSSYYNHIEEPELDFDILFDYGKVLNINFTDYFSDLLVLETQDPNPKYPEELDPQNFEEALTQYKLLHKKYVQLLERHNLLLEQSLKNQ